MSIKIDIGAKAFKTKAKAKDYYNEIILDTLTARMSKAKTSKIYVN